MNRRRADAVVGLLVGAVLVLGGALTWDAYQQRRAMDEMMGGSMGGAHGTDPLLYGLGTLLLAAVVVVMYATVRESVTAAAAVSGAAPTAMDPSAPDAAEPPDQPPEPDARIDAETQPRARVLDLLPEDERRVLGPVIDSPGITQIELRDRSDFSKSKVSQTVSALEKRGLLYRERQGRTYRVYPSDDLASDGR